MNINGSCFCKKIAFKGEVNPEMCFACHCEDCPNFQGHLIGVSFNVKNKNLYIKGRPRNISNRVQWQSKDQSFCEKCGTHLFASDIDKTLFNIRIGCIEQRNKLIPKKHVFASSAHSGYILLKNVSGMQQPK